MEFVGESPETAKLRGHFEIASKGIVPVMIIGETGTGKEIVARTLHRLAKDRSPDPMPYVSVNCAAIQDTLLESELFGHEKGSFTGAHTRKEGKFRHANNGVLFLDEISNMSMGIQAKILRAVEYMQFERVGGLDSINVRVKIVSATNRDPLDLVAGHMFRQDLYYRLSVIVLRIPPLRERREDIPLLANHFRKLFTEKHKKHVNVLSKAVIETLMMQPWNGNVRELRNVMERAVLFCKEEEIKVDDLGLGNIFHHVGTHLHQASTDVAIERMWKAGIVKDMPAVLSSIEKYWITKELEACNMSQKEASDNLGISQRMMSYKLAKYGMRDPNNGGTYVYPYGKKNNNKKGIIPCEPLPT